MLRRHQRDSRQSDRSADQDGEARRAAVGDRQLDCLIRLARLERPLLLFSFGLASMARWPVPFFRLFREQVADHRLGKIRVISRTPFEPDLHRVYQPTLSVFLLILSEARGIENTSLL